MKKIFIGLGIGCGCIIFLILSLVITITIISLFGYKPNQVSGRAMEPTLPNGSFIFSQKINLTDSNRKLNRGDIILYNPPNNTESIEYIHRVIAVPEDLLTFTKNSILVNNNSSGNNPILINSTGDFFNIEIPIKVPENSYFVLGDNPDHSSDSRSFGFVPAKNITAKYLFCYWDCRNTKSVKNTL
jgi:signal peptidase I